MKSLRHKDVFTHMLIASLFIIAKIREQLKCPLDEWKNKLKKIYMYIYMLIHIHTHNVIFGLKKKKEILLLVKTWMKLEDITRSEINRTRKEKHYMISLIYGIQKEKNERNRESKGTRNQVQGKWDDVGQKVCSLSYGPIKKSRDLMYNLR